uniref:C2H2-type domain-containing protein n=1 Tax=viral metagenome TaxID=1070528 RepID=A0A6C0E1V5_9ZZZZ
MDPNSKNLKKTHPYNCESCNFSTVNKKDFSRHLATDKHKILTNPNLKAPKNPYVYCTCGKSYKHSSSLCAHKKKCNLKINNNVNASQVILQPTETKDTPSDKELIMMLVQENVKLSKDNHDFKEMMLELMKNGTHNVHTNSHNKTFNLQFFLNETCKDAMNIMDFVDSVKLQLSDLEKIGNAGFVNGISNIIIKNLKDLDVTKRPLHCTDSKREVLYVKDENKWEKENDEKDKMKKVINKISTKNIQQIPEWVDQHPDCKDGESRTNNQYLHIVSESMGCCEPANYDKIIHNVSKQVIVDK